MSNRRYLAAAFAALLLPAGLAAGDPPAMSEPKPGPEHEWIARHEGVWDAAGQFWFQPGQPPIESNGVMTLRRDLGGFWMVGDYAADFMGSPFKGRQLYGYDQIKKKFVSVWADSMGSWMMVSEGTYDEKTRTMTMWATSPGMDGKPAKWKEVSEYPDDDHMNFTMYQQDAKTRKWKKVMTLAYTRRK